VYFRHGREYDRDYRHAAVSYRAIEAATTNPVDSLQDE
jgi:hypothetical protein